MIQWIDLAAHGFQLRGAQRDGEPRRVVAVPSPIEGELSDAVVERLSALGFERSGAPGVWHREARGLLVTDVLATFPQGVLAPISANELFTAPWPDGRDRSPLGLLADALAEHRAGEVDMLGTGTALVRILSQASREAGETIWARWADLDAMETLGGADARQIAIWMESNLMARPMRTFADPDRTEADPVVEVPAIRGRGGFAIREALEAWRQQVHAPRVRELDVAERRAQDVAHLFGETPRVELARHCVAASRRCLAMCLAELEAAEEAASEAEVAAEIAEWAAYEGPPEDADVRHLMREAGLDPDGSAVGIEAPGLRGVRPADSGAIVFFGRALDALSWQVQSQQSVPTAVVNASREVAAKLIARSNVGNVSLPVVLLRQAGDKVLALDERLVHVVEALVPGGTWRGPDRTEQERLDERNGGGAAYEVDGELVALVAPLMHVVSRIHHILPSVLAAADAGFPGAVAQRGVARAADGAGYRGFPAGASAARVDLDVSAWAAPTVMSGATQLAPQRYIGVPLELAARAEAAHAIGAAVPWTELASVSYGRVLRDLEPQHPMPYVAEVLPDRVMVGWRRSELDVCVQLLANRRQHSDVAWFLEVREEGAPILEVHAPWQRERIAAYRERVIIPANEDLSVIVLRRPVGEEAWVSAGVFEPVPARTLADDAIARGLTRIAHAEDPAVAQAAATWEARRAASGLDAELGGDAKVAEEEFVLDDTDDDTDDDTETETQETKARIEDFGEKIGGARKDINGLGSRALEVAMTEAWTSDELREYLTKERLWPFSVKQRLADGAEPGVVALEKNVRDNVRPEYHKVGRGLVLAWDDALARQWASGVRVMASVFHGVNTIAQLKERAIAAFDAANPVARARLALTEGVHVRRYRAYWRDWVGGLASADDGRRFGIVGSIEANGRVLMARRSRNESRAEIRAEVQARRPQKDKAPRISERPHLAAIGRTGPEVRIGNVTPEVLAQTFGFRGGEFGNWLGQKERQEVLNFAFESFHDLARVLGVPPKAVSLNGELAIAFGARGTGGKRSAAAHYETGRRVINLTRMNGAGSLAHEFAHAFDHYIARTLAPALGRAFATEPGDSLGANGLRNAGLRDEVAVAVSDVVRALFWYEPSNEERSAAARSDALSEVRQVRERWARVLDVSEQGITWQIFGDDHLAVLADPEVHAAVQTVNAAFMKLCDVVRDGLRELDTAVAEMDVDTEGSAARVKDAGARIYDARLAVSRAWETQRESTNEMLRKIALYVRPEATGGYAKLDAERAGSKMLEWRALEKRLLTERATTSYRTQYVADAIAIDAFEQRKKDYWAQPIELFARAFEAWVFDRLRGQGEHCDYLVHGVEDKGFTLAERGEPTNSDDVRAPGNRRGLYAYPRGVERARINAAFDGLAQKLRHEVTPEGNCKLYQRRPSPLGPGQGLSVEAVVRAVHRFSDALRSTCAVEVVADVSELPAPAPADVAGLFDAPTRTVYLVAANLRSPGEVNATLTHEILRHAGVFALLGDQKDAVLDAVWADNPAVRMRADRLRSEGISDGILFTRSEATEEALAQLADEGALVKLSGWARAAAWIRSALRDIGLGALVGRWDDRDVAYLVSRAARASGLRPHALPTAGTTTPDGWMMRFLEAPRRALTAGAFLGSLIGAGVFTGWQAPPVGALRQAPLTWPEVYAPQCVDETMAREEIARRWARFGIPQEAFATEIRGELVADMERARAALRSETERLEERFEAALEAARGHVETSTDPVERIRAEAELKRLEDSRDSTYAALADQIFANVDAQVLAALNAECRAVAEAFAPPVRWPDPRSMAAPEEDVADLKKGQRVEPAM